MADKDKILTNAKEWFGKQDIPHECPRGNCRAVDKWRLSDVSKVNRLEQDNEIGGARKIVDPELFVVQMVCSWCGYIERTYKEELPLNAP